MKVKDLKKLINDLPDEMEIILSQDTEGNSYSPLDKVDSDSVYIPETTWYGEVYSMSWSAEEACMSEETWEKVKSRPRALILYPIN